MKLSIVTTIYNSSRYIQAFCNRIENSVKSLGISQDYELIIVNDGSPDDSLKLAVKEKERNPKIKVIDLSRNFGHHKAIMTGLNHAKGENIFLIDIDLEEDPALLKLFWEKIEKEKDTDVLYGIQKSRKGGIFEKISGWLFYALFNLFSEFKLPKNLITCRIMRKRYVEELLRFKEQELSLAGIMSAAGFNQKPITVQKNSSSPTTYSLKKKIDLFFNAITSFSNTPLVFVFRLGITITLISIMYSSYIMYNKIFIGIPISGWASTMASIWLLSGLIIFSLGIVSIYISKIFTEVKRRPYTIIKKIY